MHPQTLPGPGERPPRRPPRAGGRPPRRCRVPDAQRSPPASPSHRLVARRARAEARRRPTSSCARLPPRARHEHAPRKPTGKDGGKTSKPGKPAPVQGSGPTAPAGDGRPTLVASHGEPRRLTDAREMRALAHPIRVQLLEAITREGPLTATEAAELVGESPANCSFHLRTLAKYGFVEEAPGGSGRSRPWRRTSLGISLTMADEDGEASVAAHTLAAMNQERVLQRLREWTVQESSAPIEWRTSAFADTFLSYLTPDELRERRGSHVRRGGEVPGPDARPGQAPIGCPPGLDRSLRSPLAAGPLRELSPADRPARPKSRSARDA